MAGPGSPTTGFTGADGQAEITVTPEILAAATVVQMHPPLDAAGPVRAVCTRITTTHPDFPEGALDSWGAHVMGFGWLPSAYRGSGVRIALINSGVGIGYPDLSGRIGTAVTGSGGTRRKAGRRT